jgi:hypothetical protein
VRHELRVLRRQINRPQLTPAGRLIMAAFHRLVSRPALGGLVEPETVLGWHRELVRRQWATFGRRRGVGRPRLEPNLRELILRMARENPNWGCVRIRGELLKVGRRVCAPALRPLIYGARDEADRMVCGDGQSRYSLGDSAGPEPGLAAGRFAGSHRDPRPRRQVRRSG